jgi:mRNA interferase RelE/StbE
VVYKVVFRDEARKAFERLDRAVREQVGRVIDRLADNPRPGQATQLVGDPRTWRVRAGDWQILYEIRDDEIVVLILDVKHRSKAYGGRSQFVLGITVGPSQLDFSSLCSDHIKWGGWGSNPRPADYEKHDSVHRTH